MTFARPDTPIVCLASSDKCKRSYEIDLLHDLHDRGLGKIALVGDPEASSWPHDWFIKACSASLPDHLRTAFEVVFLQLLAYQLSLRAGVDPDDPSPGGVVTRVVRPFQIHDEFCDA